jgi:hypothetical protein
MAVHRHPAGAAAQFVRCALAYAGSGACYLRLSRAPVLAALALVTALSMAVPAQAFETELKTPEGGTFPPTGPLEVLIPADVPDEQLARLHMVIDGIDQRTRIEVRGKYARLVPAEPLTPGVHQLDLVELMPDGTVVTHGSWEFTVAGEASLSGGTVRYAGAAAVTSDTAGTFLAKNSVPDPIASTGSLDMQGRAEGSWWQVGARLPFVYDTSQQTLDDRSFDVADYLFDAKAGPVSAFAGHHGIQNDNVLLQNGLSRRGVSGRLDLNRMNSNVSVFQMQSSYTSGFDNFLGLSDRNDRVKGIAAAATPVDTAGFGMDVSFSYLDGRDPQLGPSTGSLLPRREAESWGMSTTLKFLQNTLSVRGDFAHSDFEIPDDPGVDPENGEAYKLALAWSPATAWTVFGDEARFMFGSEYQRYSTFFTNPANTGEIRDLERYSTMAQLTANEWNVGTQFSQAYDNVDDNPLLPRTRGRGAGMEIGYTPAPAQDPEGNASYGWLGNPAYGLSLAWTDIMTVDAPRVGPPGDQSDSVNGQAQARVDFDKGAWQWGVSYGAILTDDRDLNEMSVTHSAGAQASFTFASIGLSLAPSLQYDRTNLDRGRADSTSVVGNLSAIYTPTDVPVLAGLNFNFSRSAASDDTFDTNTWMTSANVGWIALDGAGEWPRLIVSLEGTHQLTDDLTRGGTSTDNYVAFLKASLGWSRNFGTQ